MTHSGRPRIYQGFDGILHGGDYNPDQWLDRPEVIEEDFRLMKVAGCNTFSIGIFSWASYEPEEGKFDFSWLDRIMDRMAHEGHNVNLATPSGSKPPWMSHKYPEIRKVNQYGLRAPHAERHNHCWSSPVYRDKVRIMNTKLAERYQSHPALKLWHVSNEYGGDHGGSACYCDLCLKSFHGWLEQKYGTLKALNDAYWASFWSHTFTSFSQIDPRDPSVDGLRLDFMRFCTWQIADFYEFECEPLKRLTPNVPCTTNFMGVIRDIDYAVLARHVDVVGDDVYPFYNPMDPNLADAAAFIALRHDLYRSFKPDRPHMLMESCPDSPQWLPPMRLKRPGLHRAEMFQAIGHGVEATLYFQWRKGRGGQEKFHGAVVDHVGHENTRVFQQVAAYGQELPRLSKVVGSEYRSKVAITYDQDSRWGMEFSWGAPHQRDGYLRTVRDHHAVFWDQNIAVDVFESTRPFDGYDLVILPQLWILKPGVADALKRFVAEGGTLVATNCTAICDEFNRCFEGGWPGGGLMELFGIWEEEFDVVDQASPFEANALDFVAGNDLGLEGRLPVGEVRSVLHAEGAEVVATFVGDFYAGRPAITRNRYGKGEAYFLGARLPKEALEPIYRSLRTRLNLQAALPIETQPGVSAQKRVTDTEEFVFIENFSRKAQRLDLTGHGFKDALTREAVGVLELPMPGSAVLERGR